MPQAPTRHLPAVLPALRDVADMLSRWRGSPLQDLFDAAPPAEGALRVAANAIDGAMDTLAQDPNLGTLARELESRLASMTGPQLPMSPALGFAPSDPERLL